MAIWRVPLAGGGEVWQSGDTPEAAAASVQQGGQQVGPGAPAYAGGVTSQPGIQQTSGTQAPSGGGGGGYGAPAGGGAPGNWGGQPAGGAAPSAEPLNLDRVRQNVRFDPTNPMGAIRNVFRDMGVNPGFLQRAGPYQRQFSAAAPMAFYQYLADSARKGYTQDADSFKNFTGNFINSGFNMGGQGNLDMISSLLQRTQGMDPANIQPGSFGTPAEAVLAQYLMQESPANIANLITGQYMGSMSPALLANYFAPMLENAAQGYDEQGFGVPGTPSLSQVLQQFLNFGG